MKKQGSRYKYFNGKVRSHFLTSKIFIGLYLFTIIGVVLALLNVVITDYQTNQLNEGTVQQPEQPDQVSINNDVQAVISALRQPIHLKNAPKNAENQDRKPIIQHWVQNAVQSEPSQRPKLAVIIDDLGLDAHAVIDLSLIEVPLTFSFLPYAENLSEQTHRVRALGHELMVHLPMEPKNPKADPGRNALMTNINYGEFDRRLAWNLEQFSGFVGINNHMGSALTEDVGRMVRVMAKLKEEGYFFVDSITSPATVGPDTARAAGVPYLKRNVFIDNDRRPAKIIKQLEKAADIAFAHGQAVAIGHPYPETIDVLKRWIPSKIDTELVFVPVSRLILDKLDRESKTYLGR